MAARGEDAYKKKTSREGTFPIGILWRSLLPQQVTDSHSLTLIHCSSFTDSLCHSVPLTMSLSHCVSLSLCVSLTVCLSLQGYSQAIDIMSCHVTEEIDNQRIMNAIAGVPSDLLDCTPVGFSEKYAQVNAALMRLWATVTLSVALQVALVPMTRARENYY